MLFFFRQPCEPCWVTLFIRSRGINCLLYLSIKVQLNSALGLLHTCAQEVRLCREKIVNHEPPVSLHFNSVATQLKWVLKTACQSLGSTCFKCYSFSDPQCPPPLPPLCSPASQGLAAEDLEALPPAAHPLRFWPLLPLFSRWAALCPP